MLFLTRSGSGWRKAATAVTATALAATTLAFAGSPAQADDPVAPTLKWKISQQYINHFTASYGPGTGGTVTATDGANYASGDIDWEYRSGSVSNGVTTLRYDGTVEGVFSSGGSALYGVKVEDPEISFDAAGAGEIRATVSGGETGAWTAPSKVTVAEFVDGASAAGAFSAVTKWEGVNPDPAVLDPAKAIVDGKSFHPEFLGALGVGVRAHFYQTSGTAETKRPAAPNAGLPVTALPTVTATTAMSGSNVVFNVGAANIVPDANVTSIPSLAKGIYIGISEQRDIFAATGSQDEQTAQFVTMRPITSITDGELSASFAVDKSKLKKGTQYAVYTWTAHSVPNRADTQYSETLVEIPAAAFVPPATPKASTTKVKINKVPTTKKAGKATITVTGKNGTAAGKITFVLKKGKATKKVKAAKLNKKGKVVVKLPKLKKGKWKLTAKYAGSSKYKKSSKSVTIKVKR